MTERFVFAFVLFVHSLTVYAEHGVTKTYSGEPEQKRQVFKFADQTTSGANKHKTIQVSAGEDCFLLPAFAKGKYKAFDSKTNKVFSVTIEEDCSFTIEGLPRYSSKYEFLGGQNGFLLEGWNRRANDNLNIDWRGSGQKPRLNILRAGFNFESWVLVK